MVIFFLCNSIPFNRCLLRYAFPWNRDDRTLGFYGNDRELDIPRCAKGCPRDGSMFSFSIMEGIVREGC